jgi:hypothetical protein
MPEDFRLLDGVELAQARDWYGELVSRTWDNGIVPVDGPLRGRVVFEFGGAADLTAGHINALQAGAAAVDESDTLIIDGIQAVVEDRVKKQKETVELGVLRVDLGVLEAFCRSTDFEHSDGESWWEPDAIKDWPRAAREVLTPVFVDGWSMISAHGRWAFASFGSGDDNWLVGSQEFLDAYLAARPESIFDVLIWMHGDGSYLASGWVTRRRKSLWRWISPFVREFERAYEPHMRAALERFYPPADARWIWDTYVASDDANHFPTMISWEARESKLMEFFTADPAISERLEQIWRGN